jgi:hypothetical protein
LSAAKWTAAVAGVRRDSLFANDAELRRSANEAMTKLWTEKYCSYVLTLLEPPAGVAFEQTVDERQVFVFSPLLCPTLFCEHNSKEEETVSDAMWKFFQQFAQ